MSINYSPFADDPFGNLGEALQESIAETIGRRRTLARVLAQRVYGTKSSPLPSQQEKCYCSYCGKRMGAHFDECPNCGGPVE